LLHPSCEDIENKAFAANLLMGSAELRQNYNKKEIGPQIMNLGEIYRKFSIPNNLQEHMLRVGALAEIITQNWQGRIIDSQAIIKAALLHDIAKPLTFDLAKQAKYGLSETEINNLEKLQILIKEKYGQEEHAATTKIVASLGCDASAIRIVSNSEWKFAPKLIKEGDIESLIAIYCDMRIGLKGILTLDERLADLKTRFANEDFAAHAKNGRAIEQILQNNVSIDLSSITNPQLTLRFEQLLNLAI
jgi:putative nucleotidyltransferase with HDIG domain